MATRPVAITIICLGIFLYVQFLVPKATALKRTSNYGEFLMEDQKTHKRKNYMLQGAKNNDIFRNPNIGVTYEIEPFEAGRNPEEPPAFMVDYANMIRNDVILLDKSIETRTRKRGNIKVEDYNDAVSDSPCGCEYDTELKDLGEDAYPRFVETRNCTKARQPSCIPPYYVCQESWYDLTILRRKTSADQKSLDLPDNLSFRWIAELNPVSVGCVCKRDYIVRN